MVGLAPEAARTTKVHTVATAAAAAVVVQTAAAAAVADAVVAVRSADAVAASGTALTLAVCRPSHVLVQAPAQRAEPGRQAAMQHSAQNPAGPERLARDAKTSWLRWRLRALSGPGLQ